MFGLHQPEEQIELLPHAMNKTSVKINMHDTTEKQIKTTPKLIEYLILKKQFD